MKLKTFKSIQSAVAALLGLSFAVGIVAGKYFLPIVLLIAATLALFILRRRVNEVVADERDMATMGKAAALAIRIYCWIAVVVMLGLYARRAANPAFEAVAMTLAYSTALLMVLYSFLFKYYNRFKWSEHKWAFVFTIFLLVLVAVVAGLRLFSGEDTWVCDGGKWIAHGHPDAPIPQTACPRQ